MRLAVLLSVFLSSCTIRPTVATTDVAGNKTKLTLGGTFMAETDEVVAELEGPQGYHLRYMAKREDSTKVPTRFLDVLLGKWLGGFAAHSEDLKTVTDGEVAKAGIAADVKKLDILSKKEVDIAKIPPPLP